MNTLVIVVAVMAALFVGMGLCALGIFCYFMLQGMKKLTDCAVKVEAVVKQFGEVAERNFGEGSPTARAAKSVAKLADNVPIIVAGMDSFSKTMDVFYKAAIDPTKTAERPRGQPDDESAFYPYSEEDAAQLELSRKAKRERVELSDEELQGMVTDKPEPKVPETQTAAS